MVPRNSRNRKIAEIAEIAEIAVGRGARPPWSILCSSLPVVLCHSVESVSGQVLRDLKLSTFTGTSDATPEQNEEWKALIRSYLYGLAESGVLKTPHFP